MSRGADAFRPALRFPTDPTRPNDLPTRTKQITHVQPPPRSVRKPWELDLERLPDCTVPARRKRVIVVLGDPPSSSLNPLVGSSYLQGSLLIIVTSADASLGISPAAILPDIRILRLKHTSTAHQEVLSAARLVTILEWAHNVAADWRSDHNPPPFSVTLEDGTDASNHRPPRSVQFKAKSKSLPGHGAEVFPAADNDIQPRTAWRSQPRGRDSTASSTPESSPRSSLYLTAGNASGSVQSHNDPRPGSSTASIPGTAARAHPKQRLRSSLSTSSFHHVNFSESLDTDSRKRSASPKSRPFAALSPFHLSQDTKGKHGSKPSTIDIQRSFDVIINFLPANPAVAGVGYGIGVGPGTISSLNVQASHNKALLKQTILVTTACQRFLCPVVPNSFRSKHAGSASLSLSPRSSRDQDEEWRGGIDQPDQYRRKRTLSTSKRISSALSSMFHAKTSLPTPPTSASSSSGSGSGASSPPDMWAGLPGAGSGSVHGHGSGMSAAGHDQRSIASPLDLPKLVHVLPFSHSVPAHMVNSPMHLANARLIRSLEAFLLSWSYGGKGKAGGKLSDGMMSDDGHGDSSSQSSASGSSSSLAGLTTNFPGMGIARSVPGVVRPFLLDITGLSDVFRGGNLRQDAPRWTISDLIISSAIDNEYPLSEPTTLFGQSYLPEPLSRPQSSPAAIPSSSYSSHGHGRPIPNQWESISTMAGAVNSGETTPVKDDSWSSRRAWLGGVDDFSLYPPEGAVFAYHPGSGSSSSTASTPSSSQSRVRPISGPVNGSPPSTKPTHARITSLGATASSPPSSWGLAPPAPTKRPTLNVSVNSSGGGFSRQYNGPVLSPVESQVSPSTIRARSDDSSKIRGERDTPPRSVRPSRQVFGEGAAPTPTNMSSSSHFSTSDSPSPMSSSSSAAYRSHSQTSSFTSHDSSSNVGPIYGSGKAGSSRPSLARERHSSSEADEPALRYRRPVDQPQPSPSATTATPSRSSTIRVAPSTPSTQQNPANTTPIRCYPVQPVTVSDERITAAPLTSSEKTAPSRPKHSRQRSSKRHVSTESVSKGYEDAPAPQFVAVISPPTPLITHENPRNEMASSYFSSPPRVSVPPKSSVPQAPTIQISMPSPLRASNMPVNKEKSLPPPPVPAPSPPAKPSGASKHRSNERNKSTDRLPRPQVSPVAPPIMPYAAHHTPGDPRSPAKRLMDDMVLAKETEKDRKHWWKRSTSKVFGIR